MLGPKNYYEIVIKIIETKKCSQNFPKTCSEYYKSNTNELSPSKHLNIYIMFFIVHRDGEEWLKNRKILNMLMLRNECPQMKVNILNSADQFMDHLRTITDIDPSISHELSNIEGLLYLWSINTIIGVMVGPSYHKQKHILEPLVDVFAEQVHSIFAKSARFGVISASMAKYWQTGTWTDFEHNVSETLDLAHKIVDLVMDSMETDGGLLMELEKQGMTRDVIQRIFVDLVIAAGDTTSFSTQWGVYLLAKHRKVQTEVRNEISNDTNQTHETPLIRGTIREAMRLFPVASFIGRFLASDGIFGQYRIPKDVSL